MAPRLIAVCLLSAHLAAATPWGSPVSPPRDATLADALEREALARAIGESLDYLDSPRGARDYAQAPEPFTRARVRRTLQRLRTLLLRSPDGPSLARALDAEFQGFPMSGGDGEGTVALTGYFTPIYEASRKPSVAYRWPLYRRPGDLDHWPLPHPTRAQLEGIDGGSGDRGPLKGLELVWLANRWDAYMIQVQGSGILRFPDGTQASVGFHGATRHPYTPIALELSRDARIQEACRREGKVSLRDHFERHPEDMDTYLQRNNRFVFFREQAGPPRGSLGIPVSPMRGVAVDRKLFPGGLPLLLAGAPPGIGNRLVLAQDAGSAIQGPGRLDLYCGVGPEAGRTAGSLVHAPVRAYLLLLKE